MCRRLCIFFWLPAEILHPEQMLDITIGTICLCKWYGICGMGTSQFGFWESKERSDCTCRGWRMFANVVCGWRGVQQHFLKLFSRSNIWQRTCGDYKCGRTWYGRWQDSCRDFIEREKMQLNHPPFQSNKRNTATIQDDLCCSRWCGTHCAAHFKEAG